MQSRILEGRTGPQRTHLVFFDPGEECIQGLTDYVRSQEIDTASFTAIGGFERTRLAFFNLETSSLEEIAFHEEHVEVLSLMGHILTTDDELSVHGHVVVGRQDGTTAGGHLLEAMVNPILNVTLVELGGRT
ncbi:PPC domain-containing DNA-binding protein [Aeromicrobium sp.]|uniref:PPC domain-containing DNA-binding protein n=1 Tax=Aeromicrobium sp. TaxID=1871063 RepID=UPI003D6BA9FA